jgi:hypothetical protein
MRRTSVCVVALWALSAFGFAQDVTPPGPTLPAEILGSRLIVWSDLQRPQPVLAPCLPNPEPSRAQTPEGQTQNQPSVQIFTGMIVQEGGTFVFKAVNEVLYQLDGQEKAKLYEGRHVRIEASLDANGTVLHVTNIELIS